MIPQFLHLNPIPQRGHNAIKPLPESNDFDAAMEDVESAEDPEMDLTVDTLNGMAVGQHPPQSGAVVQSASVQVEGGNVEAEFSAPITEKHAEISASTVPILDSPEVAAVTPNLKAQTAENPLILDRTVDKSSNLDSKSQSQSNRFVNPVTAVQPAIGAEIITASASIALASTKPHVEGHAKKTAHEMALQLRLDESGKLPVAAPGFAALSNVKTADIALQFEANLRSVPIASETTEMITAGFAKKGDSELTTKVLIGLPNAAVAENNTINSKSWRQGDGNATPYSVALANAKANSLLQSAPTSAEVSLVPVEMGAVKTQSQQQVNSLHLVQESQHPKTYEMLEQNAENMMQEFRRSELTGPKLTPKHWNKPSEKSAITITNSPDAAPSEIPEESGKSAVVWDAKPVASKDISSVNADLSWLKSEQFVQDLKQIERPGIPHISIPKAPQHFAPEIINQLLPHTAAAKSGGTELLLSPEELGKVKFQIHQTADTVRVVLIAERPETLELFKRNSEQLLQEFKQAGFSGASLSFGQWNQQDRAAQTPGQQALLFDEDFAAEPPVLRRPPNNQANLPSGQGLDLRL